MEESQKLAVGLQEENKGCRNNNKIISVWVVLELNCTGDNRGKEALLNPPAHTYLSLTTYLLPYL